ncbi:IS66 family transposase [Lactococcus lactis]|uniref:IS66 family transposase n=1 Tax=Lactococcus lactis TaxID=1358 RepID=A0A9X4NIZ0_9LACT|nr:hypothetical protein [Lactococcus lactis]MDG4984569.1 IS66 family transposase [Lactococcus lactis]
MAYKSKKKYTSSQLTELSRKFKEVAEAFEEDPKQIIARSQEIYIIEKQKQIFDNFISQKREKALEKKKLVQNGADSGSEVAVDSPS